MRGSLKAVLARVDRLAARMQPSRRRSPDAVPRRSADVVPRYRTLDGVVKAVSQTDGIGLIDVDAFTTLVVRTDNSVYRITILTPHLREVLVQGQSAHAPV